MGGPLSPARLRLKNYTNGTGTTAYTYDTQNRVATIANPDGSLGVFSYDDPDKKFIYFYEYPNVADKSKEITTVYPADYQTFTSSPGLYYIIGNNMEQYSQSFTHFQQINC